MINVPLLQDMSRIAALQERSVTRPRRFLLLHPLGRRSPFHLPPFLQGSTVPVETGALRRFLSLLPSRVRGAFTRAGPLDPEPIALLYAGSSDDDTVRSAPTRRRGLTPT